MIYPILALISIGNLEILNCVSPLHDGFSVKIERFQIKSNVPNLAISAFKIHSNFKIFIVMVAVQEMGFLLKFLE